MGGEEDEAMKEENGKWEEVMNKLCEDGERQKLVEKVCTRIRESWEDAANGVLGVRIGRGKGK